MQVKRFRFPFVGLRSVHAGGNLNNGAIAGVAARNSNNSLTNSNTNNGSQLSYDNLDLGAGPCLLAKHKNKQRVLVAQCEDSLNNSKI